VNPDDLLDQPCPCGSGKRFAQCCAPAGLRGTNPDPRTVAQELVRELAGHQFASERDLQAFVDARVIDRNRRGLDDFQGLSPLQMSALLYRPFESAPLAGLEQRLPDRPEALVLALFAQIAEAAGTNGIKLTARGNLPLKLVKVAHEWLNANVPARERWLGSITTERDVGELHVIRLVADMAGLLRKAHGRLYLTRQAEKLLRQGHWAGIYRRLLEVHCRRFNWAYNDGYPDLHIIRDSFAFSFYLLAQYGGEWRPVSFYEEAFQRAFPDAARELVSGDPLYGGAVGSVWTLRTLQRFALPYGLIDFDFGDQRTTLFDSDAVRVRRTSLLEAVFPPGASVDEATPPLS